MERGSVLVAVVFAVGVLHTLVPDHWAPIVVLARRYGWSPARTAFAAATAGLGHVTSTLVLGVLLWYAGAALAVRYAHVVDMVAAVALIGFGAWIAYAGWRELRDGGHAREHFGHVHFHRHADGLEHAHWHEHHEPDWHAEGAGALHDHSHAATGSAALLLILGSSPMIEGLPAFLAASTRGAALMAVMAMVFGVATIVTYVATTTWAILGLQRVSFGAIERYGEVLSGGFVAAVGVYALAAAGMSFAR